jgi:rhamnosyltransferase
MPQIHLSLRDTLRYIASSIAHDLKQARVDGRAWQLAAEIVRYRSAQYMGSYKGNHEHRRLSHAQKDIYFYPANRSETP